MNKLMLAFVVVVLPLTVNAEPVAQKNPSPITAPQPQVISASAAGMMTHVMLTPEDVHYQSGPPSFPPGMVSMVLSGNPSLPGLFTIRAKLPAGYKIPAHWHSTDEHVTVLSGTFYMGMADKLDAAASKPYKAGSYMVMPAHAHHFAWCKDSAVIQVTAQGPFDINYINPADDPRTTAKPAQ